MKYFDRARLMGAGRGNGFGLEFGAGVALALPSAERLFTPSPSKFPDHPAAKIKPNKHHCASLQTSKNNHNSLNPAFSRYIIFVVDNIQSDKETQSHYGK